MNYNFNAGEILLIDKPYGWSSFQAVNKVKHAIKNHPSLKANGVKLNAKVGHAGTLDPLATGLLILCTGKKTKSINELMGLEKEYTGTFCFGATTPCFDLEQPIDKEYPIKHITLEGLKEAAKKFTGVQQQTPPLYSAVKIDGKRAYELARQGVEAELKAREIEIKEFELSNFKLPYVDFRIICSKGTYIRSIARDMGLAMKSGAHLIKLYRTRVGLYEVADALTPQKFSEIIKFL